MTPQAITKMLHSRGALAVTGALVLVCSLLAYSMAGADFNYQTHGFVMKWSRYWQLPRGIDFLFQLTLNVLVVSLMIHLNKVFNLLRSLTMLQGTMFMVMQLATPALLLYLCPGTVLCIVVLVSLTMCFMVYNEEFFDTRSVFFIFFLLSSCLSFEYSIAVYIPAFIVACGQMRILNMRTISAILLGLVTPWIILFGFGLVTFADLSLPPVSFGVPDVKNPATSLLIATVVFTVFVTLGSLLQNTIKILTYNAHSRAMLSVITTLTIFTVLASVIDFSNVFAYLSLLNCLAALQVSHLFGVIHTFGKSYIALSVLIAVYFTFFVLSLVLI